MDINQGGINCINGMYSLGFLILDRKIFCTHLTSPRSFACSEACA